MILNEQFQRESFIEFISNFLPTFNKDIRPIIHNKYFTEAHSLGNCSELDIQILELSVNGSLDKRVSITTEAFKLMKDLGSFNALVVFKTDRNESWRLSLMTATPRIESGKVVTKLSNPRRLSYLLGPSAKTVTPYKYLVKAGKVKDDEDLRKRFSVEVVNKEFYELISELYTKLVGGKRRSGTRVSEFPGLLKISGKGTATSEHQEFAVRLIGRIVFCWFLREKKSDNGISLIPDEVLSLASFNSTQMIYHRILEPLFFEVLNKKAEKREGLFREEPYSLIPYLNGGLFSPQASDCYSFSDAIQAGQPGIVDVPDTWLREFVELLNTYNFTVDESTSYDVDLSVDPEMLGIIFENLLAEINPETGESARKSTGSYYTPRTIVEFMVDKTLCNYLKLKTAIDSKKIDALISYDVSDDEEYPLTKSEKAKVVDALSKLTILDPACGSGAFPIGALQKVVFILQKIDSEAKGWLSKQLSQVTPELRRHLEAQYENKNYDYLRKLGVIRESIYGVDIQPIATEIARLRCFLTLIVEESVDDKKYNRGVEPLPNLDFKFVSANSLGKLPDYADRQQQMFEDTENINALREIRNRYFGAAYEERAELQVAFKSIQHKMVLKNLDVYKGSASNLSNALARWEPFEHEPVEWFDPEWMFGIDGGFDVVIANPPYVRQEEIKDQKSSLKSHYKVFNAKADLYSYFYELSYNILAPDGLSCFISSDKWIRAKYGEGLRKFFRENTSVLKLVIFGGYQVFEATVDTNILIFQKRVASDSWLAGFVNIQNDFTGENINDYVRDHIQTIPQSKLPDNGWILAESKVLDVKNKMECAGTPLKDWDVKINFGIKTGYNKAFIIDKSIKDRLVADDSASNDLVKPVLKSSDINKYSHQNSDLWIILAKYGSHKYLKENYPAVYNYLSSFEEQLKNRGQCRYNRASKKNIEKEYPGQHHWIELDNNPTDDFLALFEKEKIVWREITANQSFRIVDSMVYVYAPSTFLTSLGDVSLKYLISVLNSRAVFWYFTHIGHKLGETGLEWKKVKIEQIPIPQATKEKQKILIEYVDKINAITNDEANLENFVNTNKVVEYEKQIDELVYELYGLSEDEISIIEEAK